jgi:hypothetical protein
VIGSWTDGSVVVAGEFSSIRVRRCAPSTDCLARAAGLNFVGLLPRVEPVARGSTSVSALSRSSRRWSARAGREAERGRVASLTPGTSLNASSVWCGCNIYLVMLIRRRKASHFSLSVGRVEGCEWKLNEHTPHRAGVATVPRVPHRLHFIALRLLVAPGKRGRRAPTPPRRAVRR